MEGVDAFHGRHRSMLTGALARASGGSHHQTYVSRSGGFQSLLGSRVVFVRSQWEETFGMVAAEAMAAGTPPVASAYGPFPELITPGFEGGLFPPADVDALVDILADIADSPQRSDGYGQHGRQTYRDRFTPNAGISWLLEIYCFPVENPVEPSGRLKDIAGRSIRSAFGALRG
jgi:glycosyltransferase involved in cell wall biosynthesis